MATEATRSAPQQRELCHDGDIPNPVMNNRNRFTLQRPTEILEHGIRTRAESLVGTCLPEEGAPQ
jgi:hypothetical protein